MFEEEDELDEVEDVAGDEPHKRMLAAAAAASDDEDELINKSAHNRACIQRLMKQWKFGTHLICVMCKDYWTIQDMANCYGNSQEKHHEKRGGTNDQKPPFTLVTE